MQKAKTTRHSYQRLFQRDKCFRKFIEKGGTPLEYLKKIQKEGRHFYRDYKTDEVRYNNMVYLFSRKNNNLITVLYGG